MTLPVSPEQQEKDKKVADQHTDQVGHHKERLALRGGLASYQDGEVTNTDKGFGIDVHKTCSTWRGSTKVKYCNVRKGISNQFYLSDLLNMTQLYMHRPINI